MGHRIAQRKPERDGDPGGGWSGGSAAPPQEWLLLYPEGALLAYSPVCPSGLREHPHRVRTPCAVGLLSDVASRPATPLSLRARAPLP